MDPTQSTDPTGSSTGTVLVLDDVALRIGEIEELEGACRGMVSETASPTTVPQC